MAFTLDSCVRLWDYVSGTCKKTYQGHVNTKFSIGGAFGIDKEEEGFIVSGSEDGELLFWDFRTKEIAQRVSGHEGVVCWVDTSPGPSRLVVSGGMDGTVRIWTEVDDNHDMVGIKNGLEHENGVGRDEEDVDMDVDMVKVEDTNGYEDTHIDEIIEERSPLRGVEQSPNGLRSSDRMDED